MPGKRTYTPAERAAALDALARNGGAIRHTARQVGVPYSTLWEWASEREHPGGEAHASGPSGPSMPAALRTAARALFDQIPASAEAASLPDVVAAIEKLIRLAEKLDRAHPAAGYGPPSHPDLREEYERGIDDTYEHLVEALERRAPRVGETAEAWSERTDSELPPQARPGATWDGWMWITDPNPVPAEPPSHGNGHTSPPGGAYG